MSEQNNNQVKQAKVPRESVLDPRRPGLVQPFKRMVEDGLASITVEFTQLGFQATGIPQKALIDVAGSGLEAGRVYPIMSLLKIAEGANLLDKVTKGKKKTGGKVEQPLPSKSLCVRDFEGTTNQQLINRATAVASSANGGTLTGRARQAGAFHGSVTTSYQDWWEEATARERATSLCQGKNLAELSDVHIARLTTMPCPFRGSASFVVSEEDGDDEDEAETHETQQAPSPQPKTPTPPNGGRIATPPAGRSGNSPQK